MGMNLRLDSMKRLTRASILALGLNPSIKRGLCCLLALSSVTTYAASSPVAVESLSTSLSDRYPGDSQDNTIANDVIEAEVVAIEKTDDKLSPMDLQYQMQVLQQEVMNLRGLVEALGYELKRSKAVQDDRYLELDRRLQSQMGSSALSDVRDSVPASEGEAGGIAVDANKVDSENLQPTKAIEDEKIYYDRGLSAIQSRQYDQAVASLRSVIEHYPEGTYAANAYYWIGEVHAAKPDPDYESARQALVQVVTGFPMSNKVPDAGFKLGKVYHLMGDCQRAKETLQSVATDFSDKSAGKLADKYLTDQIDC